MFQVWYEVLTEEREKAKLFKDLSDNNRAIPIIGIDEFSHKKGINKRILKDTCLQKYPKNRNMHYLNIK